MRFLVVLLCAVLALIPIEGRAWTHGQSSSSPSCPQGTSYPDGCSGAPSGTIQFPSLLSSYVKRPPWNVAGVDYYVGVPAGTTLQDAQTISMAGVTVTNSPHKQVKITGNNITLNAIDFSVNGGYGLYITGNNVTITNSYFKMSSSGGCDPVQHDSGTGLVLMYDTFDGDSIDDSGCNNIGGLLNLGNGATIEYCYAFHAFDDFVDFGLTNVVKYNLFYDNGMVSGPHPDWLQLGGGNYAQDFEYNTFFQDVYSLGGSQGVIVAGFGTWTVTNATVSSNTMVATSPGPGGLITNFIYSPAPANLTGSFFAQHNYLDITGMQSGPFNKQSGTWSDNWNMKTGGAL